MLARTSLGFEHQRPHWTLTSQLTSCTPWKQVQVGKKLELMKPLVCDARHHSQIHDWQRNNPNKWIPNVLAKTASLLLTLNKYLEQIARKWNWPTWCLNHKNKRSNKCTIGAKIKVKSNKGIEVLKNRKTCPTRPIYLKISHWEYKIKNAIADKQSKLCFDKEVEQKFHLDPFSLNSQVKSSRNEL